MNLIPVVCPHCETRFQLQGELVGKRMRCPNATCRQTFVVQPEGQAPEAAPETPAPFQPPVLTQPPQKAGSVGDLVPILPAVFVEVTPEEPEASEPAAAPEQPWAETPAAKAEEAAPRSPPGWMQAPPVRTDRRTAAPPTVPMPQVPEPKPASAPAQASADTEEGKTIAPVAVAPEATMDASTDGPTELAAGLWDAPPVRQGLDAEDMMFPAEGTFDTFPDSAPDTTVADEAQPPARGSRRNLWIAVAIFGLAAGGVGLGIYLNQGKQSDAEEKRSQLAAKEYQEGHFAEAAALYHFLEEDFPDSDKRATYHFIGQLAALREPLQSTQSDPKVVVEAFNDFRQFVMQEASNPLLDEHRGEVGDTLRKAGEDLTSFAAEKLKKDNSEAELLADNAELALLTAAKFQSPNNLNAQSKLNQALTTFKKVSSDLAAWKDRQRLLVLLTSISEHPVGNVVAVSKEIVKDYAQKQPQLASDPEVVELLKKMPALHRAGIKYTTTSTSAQPVDKDGPHLSFYWTDVIHKGKLSVAGDQRPILALARGVLYALEPTNGKVRWVLRVGVDTTALPLWLPAAAAAPERLLVLAADRQALLAVAADSGKVLWQQSLSSPCLGQPVLLEARAFVAGNDGHVDEIDTTDGKRVGHYDVGQSLTGWGTHQAGSSLLYFAADRDCVYVLDADKHACVRVLYSHHPGLALRGPPVVAVEPGSTKGLAAPGVLLLAQTDGVKNMKLRVFALPLEESDQPDALPPQPLPGWTWFAPYQTSEQVALVTDAGHFAAFGLKQHLSHDAPLFPLWHESLPQAKLSLLPPRAQVLHVAGNSYWVLASGKIYRLETGMLREVGPKIQSAWEAPLGMLGSPLQPAQIRPTHGGESALFLLTQQGDSGRCVVSALETPLGELQWQSQLGLACGPFVSRVGEQIAVVDQQGHVLVFHSQVPGQAKPGGWLDAATILSKKMAAKGKPLQLLGGKQSTYLLSRTLSVLHLREIPSGADDKSKQWDIVPTAPLAGTAALSEDTLVLPLADGSLLRHSLAGKAKSSLLLWRSEQADTDAAGHVLWLGGDDFLVTDGSKGIRRVHWPAGEAEQEVDFAQLSSRISRPPVLLGAGGKTPLVVLADAEQGVSVLQANTLKVVRHWPGQGNITAGPFVRGDFLGYIVDQRQLVWRSPDQQTPLWTCTAPGPIVGEPQLVGKYVLVADLSGKFTLLDAATGQVHGQALALPPGVAAEAAPVAWDAGHVFAPLTDGTVMRLTLE